FFFFFSSRRRHTRFSRDWSSDVCSSDLLFRKHKVTRHLGHGRIVGPNEVEIRAADGSTQRIGAQRILIATGSVPSGLPGVEIDEIGRASCRERGWGRGVGGRVTRNNGAT